ncbi:MAG: acyl-CoA dehydrogenase family protein [Ilumatobacteraceae bacterium]
MRRRLAVDRDRWRAAGDAGYLGLRMPERFGGQDCSTSEALLSFEGLGLGTPDTGLVFALATQVFAVHHALLEAGTEAQLERWLPPMRRGESIGAFSMSEPEAGSDSASIRTVAEPDGTGYRLTGEKRWVTLAPVADVAIVFASTDLSRGRWGITAFLVPLDTPGVHVGEVEAKSGLRSCPFSRLSLDGVAVPRDAVLGAIGAGSAIFTSAVEAERAFLFAAQLGAMERVLERSVERARTRRQFDRAIGEFQAVSHRIVDMKLRHEVGRLLVYKAAELHDRGRPIAMATSLAKLYTSESAVASALDAMRTFGAEGYTEEAGLEMDLRDAIGSLNYSGTSDLQRNLVARLLGVDRPLRRPTSNGGVS